VPHTTSTVRSLSRELAPAFTVATGEDVDAAMRRIDRAQTDAVCRHLLGELPATGAPRRVGNA